MQLQKLSNHTVRSKLSALSRPGTAEGEIASPTTSPGKASSPHIQEAARRLEQLGKNRGTRWDRIHPDERKQQLAHSALQRLRARGKRPDGGDRSPSPVGSSRMASAISVTGPADDDEASPVLGAAAAARGTAGQLADVDSPIVSGVGPSEALADPPVPEGEEETQHQQPSSHSTPDSGYGPIGSAVPVVSKSSKSASKLFPDGNSPGPLYPERESAKGSPASNASSALMDKLSRRGMQSSAGRTTGADTGFDRAAYDAKERARREADEEEHQKAMQEVEERRAAAERRRQQMVVENSLRELQEQQEADERAAQEAALEARLNADDPNKTDGIGFYQQRASPTNVNTFVPRVGDPYRRDGDSDSDDSGSRKMDSVMLRGMLDKDMLRMYTFGWFVFVVRLRDSLWIFVVPKLGDAIFGSEAWL